MKGIFGAIGILQSILLHRPRSIEKFTFLRNGTLTLTLLISGGHAVEGHQQPISRSVTAARGSAYKFERRRARKTPLKYPSEPLPYSIEVNLGTTQPEAVLTLAVGTITIVHCPEPPRRVMISDRYQTSISQFIGGPRRSDIYIRPLKSGVTSNMIIEMPSAVTTLRIKTISVKNGVKVGDYHGEVTLRLPGYLDESVKLKLKVAELEKQVRERDERIRVRDERAKQLEAAAIERERIASAQAEQQALSVTLSVVEKLSGQALKKQPAVSQNKIRVMQVGRAVRDKNGRWWSILMLENQGKNPVVDEDLRASNGAIVKLTTSRRQIRGREKVQLAVLIDSNPSLTIPPNLIVVINGMNFNISLKY